MSKWGDSECMSRNIQPPISRPILVDINFLNFIYMQNLTDYAGMDALDAYFPETNPIDVEQCLKRDIFDNPFNQH